MIRNFLYLDHLPAQNFSKAPRPNLSFVFQESNFLLHSDMFYDLASQIPHPRRNYGIGIP